MPCFPIPNLGYQVAGSCAASAVRRPSSPRLRALCIGAALAPPTAGTDVDDGHETDKLGGYIPGTLCFLYFGVWTLQKLGPNSIQNKGHLGSKYIKIIYTYFKISFQTRNLGTTKVLVVMAQHWRQWSLLCTLETVKGVAGKLSRSRLGSLKRSLGWIEGSGLHIWCIPPNMPQIVPILGLYLLEGRHFWWNVLWDRISSVWKSSFCHLCRVAFSVHFNSCFFSPLNRGRTQQGCEQRPWQSGVPKN